MLTRGTRSCTFLRRLVEIRMLHVRLNNSPNSLRVTVTIVILQARQRGILRHRGYRLKQLTFRLALLALQ